MAPVQVSKPEQLTQILQHHTGRPGIYRPDEWASQFSLMPITGRPFKIEVTNEDGTPPQTYIAAMAKGADGKFDRLVLVTPKDYYDIVKKEAIEGVVGKVASGVHPVTGASLAAGNQKMGWIDRHGNPVELGFKVQEVLVDPSQAKVIKPGEKIIGAPQKWFVVSDTPLQPGQTIGVMKGQVMRYYPQADHTYTNIYADPMKDPVIADLDTKATIYIKGHALAERTRDVYRVPAAMLAKEPSISFLKPPEAAAPAVAVKPVAAVVVPVIPDPVPVPGEPRTAEELKAMAAANNAARNGGLDALRATQAPVTNAPAAVVSVITVPTLDIKTLGVLMPETLPTDKNDAAIDTYSAASKALDYIKWSKTPDEPQLTPAQINEVIKSYADKKSPYADVLKAANDELQKPGADPAAIHQKYAEQIHAIIKKETAAPEEPKNETPVPVKTALAPSGGPVLKDGNVITVDLGDNQGARALWKNENGSFTAVTAEDLIDNKMGEAAKYMPNSEAEATPLLDYINRVSKAYETVNDANDGTGPAHVDLSAKTKAEQDAAIEEMGRKNTESAPRVLQQQATTTQVYQPV